MIAPGEPGAPVHVAFAALDRATVDAFYEAALAAGGRDNGAPGLRPRYHAGYYAMRPSRGSSTRTPSRATARASRR